VWEMFHLQLHWSERMSKNKKKSLLGKVDSRKSDQRAPIRRGNMAWISPEMQYVLPTLKRRKRALWPVFL
jgi:hypothetical protein